MAAIVTLGVHSAAVAQSQPVWASTEWGMRGWGFLGAGLGLGVAALGGAVAQGRVAAAALEGIARNPGASDKLFTPFILAR